MRFTVSSSALSSKLNMLAKVIGSKNSLPILDNFLFQVAGGEMTITASDNDNVIKSTIALTDSEGEGEFCVANRVILDALKELPEQPLQFDVDIDETYAIKIVYQNGLYNFTGLNAEDYPRSQPMSEECTSVVLSTDLLIDNINRSLFATASDELRPVMNGIYFDFTADALAVVASDGHKLVRSRNYSIKSENPSAFNLPKKPATLLKNILSKEDEATIKFDARNAEVEFSDGLLRCRLIDGRYPNYNSVIPTDNPCIATVDRKGLQSALRRVLPFASESSQLIRFHIENGRFEVSSEDIDFATSAKEVLSCEYTGTKLTIGFKGSSLMEILGNLTSDQVMFQLADPSRAGVIVPAEQPKDEDVLMLIMPMLLND